MVQLHGDPTLGTEARLVPDQLDDAGAQAVGGHQEPPELGLAGVPGEVVEQLAQVGADVVA